MIKSTDITTVLSISPKTGKKYSPTPAGNSLISVFGSVFSGLITQVFIMKNQPDKNAPIISPNKTIAKSRLIRFPLIENKIYKLDNSENKISGVAKIMYLFVSWKLSFI